MSDLSLEHWRERRAAGQAPRLISLTELSYAGLGTRPGVDSVILGPGTLEHLDAVLEARSRVLDHETRQAIEAVYIEFQGTDARYARV